MPLLVPPASCPVNLFLNLCESIVSGELAYVDAHQDTVIEAPNDNLIIIALDTKNLDRTSITGENHSGLLVLKIGQFQELSTPRLFSLNTSKKMIMRKGGIAFAPVATIYRGMVETRLPNPRFLPL